MLRASVIDADTLTRFEGVARALFLETFEQAPSDMIQRLALEVQSRTDEVSYNWLGQIPSMTEWLGERIVDQLQKAGFTITNKRYQSAIAIPRKDFELDRLGMHRSRIQDLALEAAAHPLRLIGQLLIDGDATLCYDGQYFFDTDHAEGDSGTQSNKLTGTGTTLAQIKADYISAKTAMAKFKGDKGRHFRLTPDLVVCPVELETTFKELFNSTVISNTSNVLVGECDVLALPELSADDVDDWYLVSTRRPVKPFIYQVALPVQPEMSGTGSDHAFDFDEVRFGVSGYYNAGYGLWQMAVKVVN